MIQIISRAKVSSAFTLRIKNEVFEAIMRQDTAYFAKNDAGAVQQLLQSDCEEVARNVLDEPLEIFQIVISIAFQGGYLYVKCPGMVWRCFACVALYLPLMFIFQKLEATLNARDHRVMRALHRKTDETLHNLSTVREFAREGQEIREYGRDERNKTQLSMRTHLLGFSQYQVMFTFFIVGRLASFYHGVSQPISIPDLSGRPPSVLLPFLPSLLAPPREPPGRARALQATKVRSGEVSPAALVQMSNMVMGISFSLRHLMHIVPRLSKLMIPADRVCHRLPNQHTCGALLHVTLTWSLIPSAVMFVTLWWQVFALLESTSRIEPMPGDTARAFETKDGGVAFDFEGVTFAYPTLPEHNVLRKLSLTVPAGKTTSLVGERGCGKSSTVELMKRSYEPESGNGRVLVNGIPMAEWNVRSFRKSVSVVAQKIDLFGGTIKENVLYGLSDAERLERGFDGADATTVGEAELKRVCEMACCFDFIEKFPLKFETRIGTGGVKLSGGQTQCIAIAVRTLYHQ